jgi:S1-C subfamily serine protease
MPNLAEVYDLYGTAVFYIETTQGFGTGWLLELGLIVTAQHVVGGNQAVTVRHSNREAFTATVLAKDSIRDIALLSYNPNVVTISGLRPIPLASQASTNQNASPVMVLGYAESGVKADGRVGAPSAKAGIQSQITDFGASSYGRNLKIDAPQDPGDSGGPVLNVDGELIGMARAAVISASSGQRVVGVFYAVAVDEIIAALPSLRAGTSR